MFGFKRVGWAMYLILVLTQRLVGQPYWSMHWFHASTITTDPQGCFVIVSGLLYHKPVVLVNIYAPNWDDDKFIGKSLSLIPDFNSQQYIFGGDLNCVMNST